MKKKIPTVRKFVKPSFTQLIEKKRDGQEFTAEEIRFVVDSILDEEIQSHQLAALITCIYFQGLSASETACLSEEVMFSGDVVDLSSITKPKMDKYSLGGVGDKTTLILGSIAAACGVVTPCVTGQEEDFLISSSQKLSSIPGFNASLEMKSFVSQVKKINCALVEQNETMTPVDRAIYKMRQEIGIIPSLPLIASSILSKKLAEGAEGLVVDVKWGNGSFIKDLDQAKQLARFITRVARSMNRRCVALVTDMNQPLGDTVGYSLEVREAIGLLQGEGTEDLTDLVLKLGMEVVRLAGVAGSTLSAKQMVKKHIYDGMALMKFKEMIKAQGGDVSYIDDPDKLPQAKHCRKLSAPKRGYVHTINAGMIEKGVQVLSQEKGGKIDVSVGVSEIKKIGTQVKQGEPLMMIHYNDEKSLERALEYFKGAYRLAPKRPAPVDLVVERIA